MTKQKIYYKCLLSNMTSPGFGSCDPRAFDLGLALTYKENEWIYPEIEGTKLFVFDSLENGIKFPHRTYIYECEVINPTSRNIKFIDPTGVTYTYRTLIELLNLRKKHKKHKHLICSRLIPQGTIVCDAIKITKKVYVTKNWL